MNKIVELFGIDTRQADIFWKEVVEKAYCPYSNKRCYKVRKSQPDIAIGTCTVLYGQANSPIIICPNRLLQNKKVFMDCIHLLHLHQPGNDIHVISELSIPGGSVDYIIASVRHGKVVDFAGIEFQTVDTTGTVWPERQKFLINSGIETSDIVDSKTFGMNWKMTAKTILMQIHHKITAFEHFKKHMVLIIQDFFLEYMKREFNFSILNNPALIGDSLQFHSYSLICQNTPYLQLNERLSTDSAGIAECLGLNAEKNIELSFILNAIEQKISPVTLLHI